ncbi:hypothetical protein AWC38_SpisGene23327 [Stylophora pistillata]|uniref:Peptidase aspartic putative domain-containing protein n=1 Tax=Stylophora pistillata TaxID=50429 RepID=A0A2B4R8X3_STYPI|nr:hypothetical protein AWC38_SpisGene23327 [Stylophora pistillata]
MLHVHPGPRVSTEEQSREDPPNAPTSVTNGPAREGKPNERTHTTTTGAEPPPSTKFVALRTVPVYLASGKRKIKVNALLDDCSSRTYLNSDIGAELGLEGSPHELTVNVLNDNQETFETTVNIELPQVGHRTTVDVLIGVDQADLLYPLKDVKGRSGEPIARLTPLGWTCISNPDGKAERIHANFTFSLSDSNKLNSLVRRYWDIDEPTSSKTNIVNPNEKLARDTVANRLKICGRSLHCWNALEEWQKPIARQLQHCIVPSAIN